MLLLKSRLYTIRGMGLPWFRNSVCQRSGNMVQKNSEQLQSSLKAFSFLCKGKITPSNSGKIIQYCNRYSNKFSYCPKQCIKVTCDVNKSQGGRKLSQLRKSLCKVETQIYDIKVQVQQFKADIYLAWQFYLPTTKAEKL